MGQLYLVNAEWSCHPGNVIPYPEPATATPVRQSHFPIGKTAAALATITAGVAAVWAWNHKLDLITSVVSYLVGIKRA